MPARSCVQSAKTGRIDVGAVNAFFYEVSPDRPSPARLLLVHIKRCMNEGCLMIGSNTTGQTDALSVLLGKPQSCT
jgi:hypothetical protein